MRSVFGSPKVVNIRPDESCEIKRKLAADYALAVKQYSETAFAFAYDNPTNTPSKDDLRGALEEARMKVNEARLDYESHVEDHRCG